MENLKKELLLIIDSLNNKDDKKNISREFTKHALNKSIPYQVFKDIDYIDNLNSIELLCFTSACNKLLPKQKKIDVEKFFSNETIEKFKNNEVDDFVPKNFDMECEYEVNKFNFLEDTYKNVLSKSLYWLLYKSHVKDMEKLLNKDLKDFDVSEIKDMMVGVSAAVTSKRNLVAFVSRYFEWCFENDMILENTMKKIENTKDLVFTDGKEVANNIYISFEELYKEGMWLAEQDENEISYLDLAIAMLIRSGIKSQELIKLKCYDIDLIEKNVYIGKKVVPINKYTAKVIQEDRYDFKPKGAAKRELKNVDGYFIKLTSDKYDEMKAYKSIKKRLSRFKTSGFRPINENMLLTSLKIDELDKIREEKGTLTIDDYRNIQVKFGNSPHTYQKIKMDYELVRM